MIWLKEQLCNANEKKGLCQHFLVCYRLFMDRFLSLIQQLAGVVAADILSVDIYDSSLGGLDHRWWSLMLASSK